MKMHLHIFNVDTPDVEALATLIAETPAERGMLKALGILTERKGPYVRLVSHVDGMCELLVSVDPTQ